MGAPAGITKKAWLRLLATMRSLERDHASGNGWGAETEARYIVDLLQQEPPPQIVTVLVVRHPDWSNDITVSAPGKIEVRVVEADLGASFNGKPEDEQEAEVALEIAASLVAETDHLSLPDPVRAKALSWAETLRDEASEFKSPDPVEPCGACEEGLLVPDDDTLLVRTCDHCGFHIENDQSEV